ncbi:MAG: lysophospholipid acyltransferase family protein [Beijerinckiaceae bacterium]
MASFIDDVSQPKGTWRLVIASAAILLVAVAIFPFQYLSWKMNWRLGRWLPLLFHRAVLRILNIKVRIVGAPAKDRPMLILANHVSWIDIIALGAQFPLSFVAKSEIAHWPLFGLMAKLQRSIFVDRTRRSATKDMTESIANRLEEGDPIVLFAESTTSDGNRLLPFRSALVGAARDSILSDSPTAQVCLQPVALSYQGADGLPTGRMGRARIGWYGDMEMLPHLAGILRGGALEMTISYGTPLSYDRDGNRKQLTKTAEDDVRRLMVEGLTGRKGLVAPP